MSQKREKAETFSLLLTNYKVIAHYVRHLNSGKLVFVFIPKALLPP